MTISRTDASIYRGAAIVTRDGVTFYCKDGVRVTTRQELFSVPVDGAGDVDQRVSQIVSDVRFTPSGIISSGTLGALYPHTSCTRGASAMPATDKTLIVHPRNGKERITFTSSFVSKMPDLILSSTKTGFGEVGYTCVGGNAEAWSADAHLLAVADAAFSDTSLTAAAHGTVAYSAALGALGAPWNAIATRDGWTVSFDVGLEPDTEDSVGIFDYLYTGACSIRARCNPIGIKVADLHSLMKLQGTGAVRGMSALANKAALVITGASGGCTVTLNNMILPATVHQYRDLQHRVETLELVNVRSLTTGAMDALFTVAAVA